MSIFRTRPVQNSNIINCLFVIVDQLVRYTCMNKSEEPENTSNYDLKTQCPRKPILKTCKLTFFFCFFLGKLSGGKIPKFNTSVERSRLQWRGVLWVG